MPLSNDFAMEYWSGMMWADWYRPPGMFDLGMNLTSYMENNRVYRENEAR